MNNTNAAFISPSATTNSHYIVDMITVSYKSCFNPWHDDHLGSVPPQSAVLVTTISCANMLSLHTDPLMTLMSLGLKPSRSIRVPRTVTPSRWVCIQQHRVNLLGWELKCQGLLRGIGCDADVQRDVACGAMRDALHCVRCRVDTA